MQHEAGQLVACGVRERRRRIEAAADLRTRRCRAAARALPWSTSIVSPSITARTSTGLGYLDRRQRSGRNDNGSDEELKQYLHRDLLLRIGYGNRDDELQRDGHACCS